MTRTALFRPLPSLLILVYRRNKWRHARMTARHCCWSYDWRWRRRGRRRWLYVSDSKWGKCTRHAWHWSGSQIPVKYFGFHADNFGPSRWFGHPINGKPRCRSCYKEILYKFGNTSRPKLFNHLKDKHPKLFDLLLIIKLFQMQIQNTAPGLIYSLLKCLFTNLLHHLLTYYYNSTRNHLAFRCAV